MITRSSVGSIWSLNLLLAHYDHSIFCRLNMITRSSAAASWSLNLLLPYHDHSIFCWINMITQSSVGLIWSLNLQQPHHDHSIFCWLNMITWSSVGSPWLLGSLFLAHLDHSGDWWIIIITVFCLIISLGSLLLVHNDHSAFYWISMVMRQSWETVSIHLLVFYLNFLQPNATVWLPSPALHLETTSPGQSAPCPTITNLLRLASGQAVSTL